MRYDELLKTGGVAGIVVGLLPVAPGLLIQVPKARQVGDNLYISYSSEDASAECSMLLGEKRGIL